ncbi:hypothetical protein CFH99_15730 [Nocardioides aromaticivorans]|uniref:Uncharacterized protein n=1 Tax=Nocardioides aromaticivorans TaxID=200618 RepID=A0ABX7PMK3_9ACTN|nr:hypothetical protein [Nocardioides aromaticivorans]QSR27076.1 hypothetical protein CFH99_15730 [Nocardioides aromaticivorans]
MSVASDLVLVTTDPVTGRSLVPAPERRAAVRRAKEIAKGDWAGSAARAAVVAASSAASAAVSAAVVVAASGDGGAAG